METPGQQQHHHLPRSSDAGGNRRGPQGRHLATAVEEDVKAKGYFKEDLKHEKQSNKGNNNNNKRRRLQQPSDGEVAAAASVAVASRNRSGMSGKDKFEEYMKSFLEFRRNHPNHSRYVPSAYEPNRQFGNWASFMRKWTGRANPIAVRCRGKGGKDRKARVGRFGVMQDGPAGEALEAALEP